MATSKDRMAAALQQVYRNAYRASRPIVATYATPQEASRAKYLLYNATRAVRQGKVEADQELQDAVTNVSVSVKGREVTLYRKDRDELVMQMAAAAGLDPHAEQPDIIDKLGEEWTARRMAQQEEAEATPDPLAARTKIYGARG